MINFLNNFRNPRIIFAFAYDFLIAAISFWFALYLRYEIADMKLTQLPSVWSFFYISQFILVASFISNGLYRGVWRFSSTSDLIRIIRASFFALAATIITSFFIFRLQGIPRSIYFIQFFILVVGLGGGRFVYRYIKDQTSLKNILGGHNHDLKQVLIIGAGRAGEKLLRDINTTPTLGLHVLGFIDDDKFKQNALIHNKKVIGKISKLPELLDKHHIDKVFIAIPTASNNLIKKIVDLCTPFNIEVKILPTVDQILSKEVGFDLLRNVKIEDLLGRDEVLLENEDLKNMIKQKIILVTGAGGSIGSELCFQIAKYQPKMIILADYCELFLYELEIEFKNRFPDIKIIPKILDVRDIKKVEKTIKSYAPSIIFHAAAYKHVPMMEYNPQEAIGTNVVGTRNVAELASNYNVEKFILISTDKAVNPTNVMGASKRIAEMVITDLARKSKQTKFISVRFGNVLGSNGSVIPHFKKLIDERQDVTVTHPEMTRYFMSIPEAAQLVLKAGAIGEGGEIFVLDMGNPIKIVDLAKEMIKLSGLELGKNINIVFTGLRPGEKLYEELYSKDEEQIPTKVKKISVARHRELSDDFDKNISSLITSESEDKEEILELIYQLVPELNHEDLAITKEESSSDETRVQ